MNPTLVMEPPARDVPGGYRVVLKVAVPLIISTSSSTIMHFTDRVFLAWHSPTEMAAQLSGGVVAFALTSLFLGIGGYVSTFVSQYDGAGRPERIGPAVWQGIYFGVVATTLLAAASLAAGPLFRLIDHTADLQCAERVYFRVLMWGGGAVTLSAVLSSFYGGRGLTRTVMWVSFGSTAVNLVLDYVWIFGKGGFPELGIVGAAAATIAAQWLSVVAFAILFLLPANRRTYATLSGRAIDPDLLRRLLRYGGPNGVQFMLDVLAFTVFVLLVGKIGSAELAASSAAFAINSLGFIPMIGLGMATSVLVGRYIGAGRPDHAATATSTALKLTLLYEGAFTCVLLLIPDQLLGIFCEEGGAEGFEQIRRIGRTLIYFVAAYSVVDSLNIIYSAALKGAGDTRYVLWMLLIMGTTLLVVPSYLVCDVFGWGVFAAWFVLTFYIFALAAAYRQRYRSGRWRTMRVIEHAPAPMAVLSEGPIVET